MLALIKSFQKRTQYQNHSGHTGMFKRESINQSIKLDTKPTLVS